MLQSTAKTTQSDVKSETACGAKPQLSRSSPAHLFGQLHQQIGNRSVGRLVQAKLQVSHPGDAYEREADQVADEVMRIPDPAAGHAWISSQRAVTQIQRTCTDCEEEQAMRKAVGESTATAVHGLESRVDSIKNSGEPISTSLRGFYEPRFGHDFSQVRLHKGAAAGEMARDAHAAAFTVGRDIVFGDGSYAPETDSGKKLLAHELTHVVQQRAVNAPILARADPQVAGIEMNIGAAPRTGLQFWPTNVSDTRVGPVSAQAGMMAGGPNQLHAIIGENETIRRLARQLRPLFLTATPFTPAGAGAPLPLTIISEDELAQALLVFNQYYLPVPAMTNWRSGLHFPLPIDIDTVTGVATLHPLLIQGLAGSYSPAWAPQLDLSASATAAPPVATLQADVTAFLAREPTALARGIHLGVQALTNAVAQLPFIRETFRQLGAAGFDVALEFMENLVNSQIAILAAQRDGAAILTEIRNALAAAPAVPTPDQAAAIARANVMFGNVAGAVAVAPPTSARNRAEKAATIDTVQLDGSNHTPSVDVAVANAIFSQCNVRLAHGVDATATPAETRAWLGGNTDMTASPSCGTVTPEERGLFVGASARFGLAARLRAFFIQSYSGYAGGVAYSVPAYCATGPAAAVRGMLIIQNASGKGDLAHESVHTLRNSPQHLPDPNLMGSNPLSVQLNDAQCTDMYNKV